MTEEQGTLLIQVMVDVRWLLVAVMTGVGMLLGMAVVRAVWRGRATRFD